MGSIADRPALRVALFGPFSVSDADGLDITPTGRKARALFAMLALAPNGRRSRAWLQDKLWSGKAQHLGRASLRHELSHMRRHFSDAGHDLLKTHGDDIVLDLAQIETDIQDQVPPEHHELLEGLDVDDPEFEHWLSEERAFWYGKLDSLPKPTLVAKDHPEASLKDAFRKFVPHISIHAFDVIGDDNTLINFAKGLEAEISAMFSTFVGAFELIDRDYHGESSADYVLSGSVRGSSPIRVTIQAVHAPNGGVVWSYRVDVSPQSELESQEHIARHVVESIQRTLSDGASAQHRAAADASTTAWEFYQKGRALEARGGPRRLAPSLAYYRNAIDIDPNFLAARIALAFRLLDGIRNCWVIDNKASHAEASRLTNEIVTSAPENLWGQALSAFLACADGKFADGLRIMEDVVRQTPESPEITSMLGAINDYCGHNDVGASLHRHALTLSAFPPIWIRTNLALSLLVMRDPDALNVARNVLDGDPQNVRALMVQAVCLSRDGRREDAISVADTIRTLDPNFSAETWRSRDFFADTRQHTEIADELRRIDF